MKRFTVGLISLVLLVCVAGYLYVESVWNPSMTATLTSKVHAISAKHGGYVPLADIPKFLQLALIATEDQNFYHNMGFDVEGIARAVIADVSAGKLVQGASTITEQLVKDIFLTDQKSISRKIKQIAIAIMLTQRMSKNEILGLYLNEVYLGHGAYGVGDAAKVYFHRSVTNLTPAQCALIAGLPQAPKGYDPLLHPQLAKQRQLEVLQRMVSVGDISKARSETIAKAPLGFP